MEKTLSDMHQRALDHGNLEHAELIEALANGRELPEHQAILLLQRYGGMPRIAVTRVPLPDLSPAQQDAAAQLEQAGNAEPIAAGDPDGTGNEAAERASVPDGKVEADPPSESKGEPVEQEPAPEVVIPVEGGEGGELPAVHEDHASGNDMADPEVGGDQAGR